MSGRPPPIRGLAGVLAPGVVGVVVLLLLAGSAARLSSAAQWLLVPAVGVVFSAGAAVRLARMGYRRPTVLRVAGGLAVLGGLAAVWGLLTDDVFRALGLALLAGASVGLVCAVVAVVSAVRADRRAVGRRG